MLNVFENNYKNYCHKKNIKFQLLERIKNNNTIVKSIDESIENCIEHKMYNNF